MSTWRFVELIPPVRTLVTQLSKNLLQISTLRNHHLICNIESEDNLASPLFSSIFLLCCKIEDPLAIKQMQDTVMLGADFYETDAEVAALLSEGRVPIGIGENSRIRYGTSLKLPKWETESNTCNRIFIIYRESCEVWRYLGVIFRIIIDYAISKQWT